MAGHLSDTDILVIGAGPAGSATAICCLKHGLSVTVLEREQFPRDRPGETLHPGIEVVLRSLDVFSDVVLLADVRHRGIFIRSDAGNTFKPYGADKRGDWYGFQVLRSKLDACLLQKAIVLGARVHQPVKVQDVITKQGRVIGVTSCAGEFLAKIVVDATGNTQWLRKKLKLGIEKHSSNMVARYGYVEQSAHAKEPIFSFHENGWAWKAKISEGICQWTEVTMNGQHTFRHHPNELLGAKGADVTWRCVPDCAGPGYFITGDAAAIIDPAASRGVLRALYSGIMVGEAIRKVVQSGYSEEKMVRAYRQWLIDWFSHDCSELRRLYQQHGCNI